MCKRTIQPTSTVHSGSVCGLWNDVWRNECKYQETLPPGSVNQSINIVTFFIICCGMWKIGRTDESSLDTTYCITYVRLSCMVYTLSLSFVPFPFFSLFLTTVSSSFYHPHPSHPQYPTTPCPHPQVHMNLSVYQLLKVFYRTSRGQRQYCTRREDTVKVVPGRWRCYITLQYKGTVAQL